MTVSEYLAHIHNAKKLSIDKSDNVQLNDVAEVPRVSFVPCGVLMLKLESCVNPLQQSINNGKD